MERDRANNSNLTVTANNTNMNTVSMIVSTENGSYVPHTSLSLSQPTSILIGDKNGKEYPSIYINNNGNSELKKEVGRGKGIRTEEDETDIEREREDNDDEIRAVEHARNNHTINEIVGEKDKEKEKVKDKDHMKNVINIARKKRFSVLSSSTPRDKINVLEKKLPHTPGLLGVIATSINVDNNVNSISTSNGNHNNNNTNIHNNNKNDNNTNIHNNNKNDNNNNNNNNNNKSNNKNQYKTNISSTVAGVIAAARSLSKPKYNYNLHHPIIKPNNDFIPNISSKGSSNKYNNKNKTNETNNENSNNNNNNDNNNNNKNDTENVNFLSMNCSLSDNKNSIPLVVCKKIINKTDNKINHNNNNYDDSKIDLNSRITLTAAKNCQFNSKILTDYKDKNDKKNTNEIKTETDDLMTFQPLIKTSELENEHEKRENGQLVDVSTNLSMSPIRGESLFNDENMRTSSIQLKGKMKVNEEDEEGRGTVEKEVGNEVEKERPITRRGSARTSPSSVKPFSSVLHYDDGNMNTDRSDKSDFNNCDNMDELNSYHSNHVNNNNSNENHNSNDDNNSSNYKNNINISINDVVFTGLYSNSDVLVITFNNDKKIIMKDDKQVIENNNDSNSLQNSEKNKDIGYSAIYVEPKIINININDVKKNKDTDNSKKMNNYNINDDHDVIDQKGGYIQICTNYKNEVEDEKIKNNQIDELEPRKFNIKKEILNEKEDNIRTAQSSSFIEEASLKKNVPHPPNSIISSFNSLRGKKLKSNNLS